MGMSSLWMGQDHLVFVKGSGFLINFTEYYRRFRYQDIQYLTVTPTSRAGGFATYLLGLLAFGGTLIAIVANRDAEPLSVFLLVTLSILSGGIILFMFLFMRHLLLGPTCVCDLKTSLKQERLGPLNRLYLANQALDVLEEVIREKQTHLTQISGASESGSDLPPPTGEDRLSIGKTVLPAFIDYSLFGVVALAALHLESVALCAAGLVLIILGNLMLVRSLIRSYRYASPDAIRRLLFALLTSIMIFGGVAMVYFIQIVSSNPVFLQTVSGPFEAFAAIPTLGGLVYYLVFLVPTLLILAVSLTGLFQTLKWQKRLSQAEEVES